MDNNNNIIFNIFGSCVSRDIFRITKRQGYGVGKYVQSISPFSVMNFIVKSDLEVFRTEIESIDLSDFYKRLLELEYNGGCLNYVLNSSSDYLILDAGIFRYRLREFEVNMHKKAIITEDIIGKCSECKENSVIGKIKASPFTDPLDWKAAEVRKQIFGFAQMIQAVYSPEKIIVINLRNVFNYAGTDTGISYRQHAELKTIEIEQNKRMEKFFAYFVQCLPGTHYIDFPYNTLADFKHSWGVGGLHYVKEYYEYGMEAIDIITAQYEKNKEKKLLNDLLRKYEKIMWNVYEEYARKQVDTTNRIIDERNRWRTYSELATEMQKPGFEERMISFFITRGYKSCGIYSACYPSNWLILILERYGIKVDYILENNRAEFMGYSCFSRNVQPLPQTDVIVITDLVCADAIMKKYAGGGV